MEIFTRRGAPVVAVNDAEVRKITADSMVLQDVYGNRYRYGGLGEVARHYPVPKGDIDPKLRAVARRADPRPVAAPPRPAASPTPRDDVPARRRPPCR